MALTHCNKLGIIKEEKTAHPQYVTLSNKWETSVNNGNTFLPSTWGSVQSGTRHIDNWKFSETITVLDEHKLP